ncbi:MAG: endopeptidase La [Deltaproteobacteria bacterium]|nr:endopeptidase La [Deltaproteobacteria bacterium]
MSKHSIPEDDKIQIPEKLPVLPIMSTVVFPYAIIQLLIRLDQNKKLFKKHKEGSLLVVVAPKQGTDTNGEAFHPQDLYRFGVVAKILDIVEAGPDAMHVVLQGITRVHLEKFIEEESYLSAHIKEVSSIAEQDEETIVLQNQLLHTFHRFVQNNPRYSSEMSRVVEMKMKEGPGVICDLIASYINFNVDDKQRVLEALYVKERIQKVTQLLEKELEFVKIEDDIQSKTREDIAKSQREYFLRKQLDQIKRELGEGESTNPDVSELKQKIRSIHFPAEVEQVVHKELARLEEIPPAAADYHVIRNYLDWLIHLPWSFQTTDNLNIKQVKKILDEDHHGLEEVKERILEYLAVLKLKKDLKGPILCLAGPPGVGKTSLGKSIARALGRKFVRISLGGVRDEAEIRGHRRTYVGALPGRIIQTIKKAGSVNPLFMIDEIDKISSERGDPASALLEVLDPEQNYAFRDNYLEVNYDLTHVMFVTTANYLENIPAPLRDRMEIIRLPGYTQEEKFHIAKDHLIPDQIEAHGLTHHAVSFSNSGISDTIRHYTKEAGVRNLNREIAHICRKVAKNIAQSEKAHKSYVIKCNNLEKYLGPKKYLPEEPLVKPNECGVAIGLAWTPVGGEVLTIEATRVYYPGKEAFKITGQLGGVMNESVQAAITFVRAKASELGIERNTFVDSLIHIHFPAGAVPKDGPSAGITVATAVASLLSNRPVKEKIAMTGEITLRGHILPVGGIKEKVLAAYRAGIKTVYLPKKNEMDLKGLPKEVRQNMTFRCVENAEEVFKEILMPTLAPPLAQAA